MTLGTFAFDLRYCILTFTRPMFSKSNSYNNNGYVESRPRFFQLLNLLISKNFKGYASLTFQQAQIEAADELNE